MKKRTNAAQLATHAADLTGQQPPHQGDRVLALVVGRDGNIDVLQRGVSVAKRDDRDVGVRGLLDRLED